MAGAGIAVQLDSEYNTIINALRKASIPVLADIAHSGGLALQKIAKGSFEKQADPATGKKWEPLKKPRGKLANRPGSTTPVLMDYGILRKSIMFQGFADGSVVLGSNMNYARIHQEGGNAGRGRKAKIPARPYLGVPDGFERQFFSDPAIQRHLGMAGGAS